MHVSLLSSLGIFLLSALFLFKLVLPNCPLLGLLILLIYLGALLVLFSYFWMYTTQSVSINFYLYFIFLFGCLLSQTTALYSGRLIPYLLSTGYLLYLATILFYAILIAVVVLDLSLGSFR